MTSRLSALIALAFMASVGLTACGDDDDGDDVEIENGENAEEDDD